jgi:putative nucleotidyltransferase with HDIG domain
MIDQREAAANALVLALHAFEPNIYEHLGASAMLAERLAIAMKLNDDTVNRCRLGALLHDVGMLKCDRFTLRSDAMLSDQEAATIEQHAQQGSDLLGSIPCLADLAPIVRAHHERVDGSGYPDALSEHEIPLEACIIAVADAFHAMTTRSPYRIPLVPADAATELLGNSGTQFDSRVIEALVSMFGIPQRRLRIA